MELVKLVFNWTETWDHNVGEIATNEEYDSCSSDPGIVLGPGVRTVLNSTSSRFFICTVGDHREQGQKVSITVGSPTTTSSLLAPPPPSSHASSLTTTTLRTFVGLIPTLVAVISFVA
ncbi:cucumber peeling cupredoxin-like [Malus domestica]|uniref:cucumber peeling cupredoxin-like n=1 Tax=Malus domestica TaxID=3750 RepID=UPI0010AA9F20|nr:cucumber peeling cupredoxin-like [Malus domestica]